MFQTWRYPTRMLSPPSLLSTPPHHTHSHTHAPSWTARGRRHSGQTHNTDELQRLLFKDTLRPADRRPSLPAPPDTCELFQKSGGWLVTADCLWCHRVDAETAPKQCSSGRGSSFCWEMEQYWWMCLQGLILFGLNCASLRSWHRGGGWVKITRVICAEKENIWRFSGIRFISVLLVLLTTCSVLKERWKDDSWIWSLSQNIFIGRATTICSETHFL